MPPMPRRRQLVARLWRAVEAEITALEARLGGLSAADPAREEHTKQLGLLARLIRDLVMLDQQPMIVAASVKTGQFGKIGQKRTPGSAPGDTTHQAETKHDAFADTATLRAELEKRLEALFAQAED
jgi:hypothetical protein